MPISPARRSEKRSQEGKRRQRSTAPRGRAGTEALAEAILVLLFLVLDRKEPAQVDAHLRVPGGVGRADVADVDELLDGRRRSAEDDDAVAEDERLVDRVRDEE